MNKTPIQKLISLPKKVKEWVRKKRVELRTYPDETINSIKNGDDSKSAIENDMRAGAAVREEIANREVDIDKESKKETESSAESTKTETKKVSKSGDKKNRSVKKSVKSEDKATSKESEKKVKEKKSTKKVATKKRASKASADKKEPKDKKSSSKAEVKTINKKEQKLKKYKEQVKKHYGDVDEKFLEIVVKNLGPSIYRDDAESVACSDPKELDRVRKNFLEKKLGVDEDREKLDSYIKEVCEEMKSSRKKFRAVFYYALAKKVGKESSLS
jgi:hypothetical protein